MRTRFESQRYVAVRPLIEDSLAKMLCDHVRRRAEAGNLQLSGRPEMAGALESFADPLIEHVLGGMTPRIEELCGRPLFPTYSFVRVYRTGNALEKHRDRPSCEISVSLNLGRSGRPWPLWIEGPLGVSAVELEPGDALLYRGIECLHWREPFDGQQVAQVFLHYVDQEGPYREYKFDRRPALGVGD